MDTLAGTWWHPGEPSARAPGHLVREGNQWTLRLLGTLSEPKDRSDADVLHGTHGTQPVTLLDCSRLSTRSAGNDVLDETWLVRTAVQGTAISGWDDPAFDLADAEMDDLAQFMDLRLVTHRRDLAEDADDVIVIGRPPRIEATASSVAYELASGGATTSGVRDYQHEYRASLRVGLQTPASLSDIHRHHLRPMSYLLSLATGEAIGVRSLRLGLIDPDDRPSHFPRWPVLDTDHDALPERRDTIPPNMLFTCQDWDFVTGFPRWLQTVALYGPTCDLLFSRNNHGQHYISTLFLNTVTAAESFHRRWAPGTGRATPEHKARITALVDAVPETEQKWLRERLAYSHEPSLAARLRELVAYGGTAAQPYVGKPEAWSGKVAAARNALVHRPPRRDDPEETDPEGLLALEQSVAAVTTACLMRELGFDPDDAEQRMRRGFNWNGARHAMHSRHQALFDGS